MIVKIYVRKIINKVIPCNTVVRPMLRDRIIMSKVSKNNMVGTASIPRVIWLPVTMETMDTIGIVRPILAKAEPRERFRLCWSSSFLAAW